MPLLLREPRTDEMAALFQTDSAVAVWWATRTECTHAIARSRREARLTLDQLNTVGDRLQGLFKSFEEVAPTEEVRETAERLLTSHPLRTADAFQLASAVVRVAGHPLGQPFVSLDTRLREAALREGFSVAPAAL